MGTEKRKNKLNRRMTMKILLFLYDIFTVNFAYLIAILIRFSDANSYHEQGAGYMQMFRDFTFLYTLICIVFRLYSGVWRYVGFNDLKKVIIVNLCTCIIYICGSLLIVGRMPISVYILGAGIQFIMMAVIRMAPRYIVESYGRPKGSADNDITIPMMIVGVGENTRIIQNKISRDGANIVRPVCVADYGNTFKGNTFNGLPVFCGIEAVTECIDNYHIRCVVIAEAGLPDDFTDAIRKLCRAKEIEIRDFLIGTEQKTKGIDVGELLKNARGPVRVIWDGSNGRFYPDPETALKSCDDGNTVESVSASGSELVIRVHCQESSNPVASEEWIRKYREETGDDISFF